MALPPGTSLPVFEGNSADSGVLWRKYLQRFNNMMVAYGIHDAPQKLALLLHFAGEEVHEIYESIPDAEKAAVVAQDDNPAQDAYMRGCDALTNHYTPRQNTEFQRYEFRRTNQNQDESIERYMSRLKALATTCDFHARDEEIKSQIISGCLSRTLRRQGLSEPNWSLTQLMDRGKALERSEAHAASIEHMGTNEETVNKVGQRGQQRGPQRGPQRGQPKGKGFKGMNKKEVTDCKFCGRKHQRKKEECPAWGKTCSKCKKNNHFAVKCRTTQDKVNQLGDEPDDETEWLNVVKDKRFAKRIECKMLMTHDGSTVSFQIDTGASVNVLPKKYADKDKIEPSETKITSYSNEIIPTLGTYRTTLKNPKNGKKFSLPFLVTQENTTPIIGLPAAQKMKLITINENNLERIYALETDTNKYREVFDNSEPGNLPGIVKLHVKENSSPVQMMTRKIPVAQKPQVRSEIEDMVKKGILVPVDEPTEWCSALSVQKKSNGRVRLCIDPRPLNEVLKRELYELPVLDDVLPELAEAKVFSKLDLTAGYLHCILDDKSSLLTTMITPFGRFRWKRLPFGLSVSSEIFQKKLTLALEKLKNVVCIADDIVVYGKGKTMEEAKNDHDSCLQGLLDRARNLKIRFNREKCLFRCQRIEFMGHVLTADGLKVSDSKVKDIRDMEKPTSVVEIQRLQGTVGYLSRFLPHLSDVLKPLRQLTVKDEPWIWKKEHDEAFKEVKRLVTTSPVLVYFRSDKPLVVQTDASQNGLGAVLLQENRPIAYASRTMTSAEKNYAQIEKEALSIVFGLEKFHIYTFGRHTLVQNDHKPIESITKKPLNKAPRRLQNLLMRILNYDTTINWIPGKDVPIADLLSRLNKPTENDEEENQVKMIQYLPLKQDRITLIQRETAEAAVKNAKKLMKKTKKAGEDPYLALLQWRNTTNEQLTLSPVQRLFGRRTRTNLPTHKKLLQPDGKHMADREKMESNKAMQANRTDSRKNLKPLHKGDAVTIQPIEGKRWRNAVVTETLGRRSYLVKTTEGRTLRRKRQHLRRTPACPEVNPGFEPATPPSQNPGVSTSVHTKPVPRSGISTSVQNNYVQPDEETDVPDVPDVSDVPDEPATRTRSGRVISAPRKLNL